VQCDHETEAIFECQTLIDLDPKYAHARLVLGAAYLKQGRFAEAGAAFEKLRELTPPDTAKYASATSAIATCKRLVENESLIPAVLAGSDQSDQPDLHELAQICHFKKRHADAVQLYRRAMAAEPGIVKDPAQDVHYWVSCDALCAASDATGPAE